MKSVQNMKFGSDTRRVSPKGFVIHFNSNTYTAHYWLHRVKSHYL